MFKELPCPAVITTVPHLSQRGLWRIAVNKKTLTAGVAALGLIAASCSGGNTEPVEVGLGNADTIASTSTSTVEVEPTTTKGVEPGTTEAPATSSTTAFVPNPVSQKLGDTLLAEALNPAAAASSARFEAVIAFSGGPDSEMPGDVEITMSGAYDTANEASELTVDFSSLVSAMASAPASGEEDVLGLELMAGFFAEPMQTITIGDTAWVKWGLLSIFTGQEDVWLETTNDASGDVTSDFGFSATVAPDEFLTNFEYAYGTVNKLGTEKVRGVNTTHYQVIIDADALAATMSAEEREEFETELGATPIGDFPMEFWIDADGLLRRMEVDLANAALASEDTEDLESGTMTFEMWDYGTDLNITPPPADQIVTEDDLGFDLDSFSN